MNNSMLPGEAGSEEKELIVKQTRVEIAGCVMVIEETNSGKVLLNGALVESVEQTKRRLFKQFLTRLILEASQPGWDDPRLVERGFPTST